MSADERPDPHGGLRVLYLTASARGDLRVDEEVGRVQEAVRAAVHRDRVRIEHQPAATLNRLLDGLTRVVPHVVSFSGHGEEDGLVFDTGADHRNRGSRLAAEVLAEALGAVDAPPRLVVLNACKTHAQLQGLVRVVPIAVGMRGSIGDPAAIAFASRFYAALADGQSVRSAFRLAKVQLAGMGLPDAELPVLEHAPDVDPAQVKLVMPPPDPTVPDLTGSGGSLRRPPAFAQGGLPAAAQVAADGVVGLPRLPSRVFVGRDDALAGLGEVLRDGPGVIVQAVVGLGGVGKSELALQYADRHRDEYDVVWWVLAETADEIQAGLADLCRELCGRVAPAVQAAAPDAAAWALGWLATHDRWLVVFDNAEDVADLEPLLGRLQGGHVLVTSRRADGWEDIGTALRLPVLDDADSVRLLEGTIDGAGGAADGDPLAQLAGELGGLPLALRQAGAYIAAVPGMTARTYLRRLRDSAEWAVGARPPRGFADPRRGARGRRSDRQVVAAVWSVTMDRAREEHPLVERVMRLLACFAPDRLPCDVLYGIPDADPLDVGEALALLASYSMIELSTDRRYVSVHRLVQAVTCTGLTEAEQTRDRTEAAALLTEALPDDSKRIETWPAWAELLPHVRQVLDPASAAMTSAIQYLSSSGDYRTALDLQGIRTRALASSRGPEDPLTLAARTRLAYLTGMAGDFTAARQLFAELLPVQVRVAGAEKLGTLLVRANMAFWTGVAGDVAAARDLYAELVPDCERALGAEHPETLIVRANHARWMGRIDAAAARDLYGELVPLYERVLGVEHPHTLTTRANFALLTGRAGDAATARDLLAELLPVRERVLGAEHPEQLATRANLASCIGRMGDPAAARDLYAELLPIRERVMGPEHPETLTSRANLALWTGRAGDAAAARDLCAELLPIQERVLGAEHPDTLSTRRDLARWSKTAME
ncbi:FxSxx-COOH system tetratricopeptide repeat protein [Actinomadura verrucosospora]|uniref:NB-ARC domain-containing protein n=1 Tax=Actinomadura verrucosospora TaxID=46165 RepID=A0A7D4AR39_ACTVE|nr:FxSxx-COOH system tetratricopeptide repeat protein [Actinomadura verrucosospora]QKG22989.1 hypothetical protein ACTIVE_4630 [Actinomadura verrucosospora]